MADKKISELNSLTGANAADGDLVAIVDVSATETKKITRSEFFKSVPSIDGGIVFNESGADVDFRIESDTNANAFFLQGSDGKIGIGTGSPLQPLHVNSSGNTQLLISSSFNNSTNTGLTIDTVGDSSVFRLNTAKSGVNQGVLSFLHNSSSALQAWNLAVSGSDVYRAGYAEHIWKTGNTERLRITSTGNVGIGTSSPTDKLHLSQDSAFAIQMERTGGTPSVCEIANSGNLLNISQNVSGIVFLTGPTPTETMRITASGYAIIPNGVTLGTAAGTYNAANTLDDYEEGTWNPEYSGQSGSPTIVYNIQEGYYTKVGNVVTVTGRISTTSTTGSFSGDIRLSNLPFTCKNVTDLGAGGGLVISASTDFAGNFPCGGFARDNAAIFTLRTRVDFASETVGMNNADMATGAGNNMSFCATYLTDQ
jgi:hypothetical protein